MLDRILSEFKWPASYTIGDDDMPEEGIEVRFPNCTIIFYEGHESEIDLNFSNEHTGRGEEDVELCLQDAMLVVPDKVESAPDFKKPVLADHFCVYASPEKVEIEVRNICILLQTYLLPSIEGDFGWVWEYNNMTFWYNWHYDKDAGHWVKDDETDDFQWIINIPIKDVRVDFKKNFDHHKYKEKIIDMAWQVIHSLPVHAKEAGRQDWMHTGMLIDSNDISRITAVYYEANFDIYRETHIELRKNKDTYEYVNLTHDVA